MASWFYTYWQPEIHKEQKVQLENKLFYYFKSFLSVLVNPVFSCLALKWTKQLETSVKDVKFFSFSTRLYLKLVQNSGILYLKAVLYVVKSGSA